jgi:sulfate permease, SulP family
MKRFRHRAPQLIETVIPGLKVVCSYQRHWLWADLFAGITIFAMLVPLWRTGGVAPVVGLYTAIGAMIDAAILGSSRRLMIGPESSSAL